MDDAQWSLAHVLKPLTGFENLYQGQNAVTALLTPSVPVPFFDSGKFGPNYFGRDNRAGKTGFDPNLIDYTPVPAGSLMKLWIPTFSEPNAINVQSYRYIVHWRLNDIVEYSDQLDTGYRLPTEEPGVPDSTIAPPAPRFARPSATRAILINQTEPAGAFDGQDTNVRREYLVVRGGEQPAQPILPNPGGGSSLGVYQQGIMDPAVDAAFAPVSAFMEFEVVIGGDAFFITVDRFGENGLESGASPWDFAPAGFDAGFSNVYGTAALSGSPHPAFNNVGVYVFWGKA